MCPHDPASISISIKLQVLGFQFSISDVVPFPISMWPSCEWFNNIVFVGFPSLVKFRCLNRNMLSSVSGKESD